MLLREIASDDKGRLAAGHARLSEDSIRLRFLSAKPRLSSTDLRYLTEIDGRDHIAIVAVAVDDPERFVGVARCVRDPEAPQVAEWAIVIADEHQGLGLGGRLSRTLALEAAQVGIRTFTATTFGENQPIQRLMRSFTTDLHGSSGEAGVRELAGDLALERLAA